MQLTRLSRWFGLLSVLLSLCCRPVAAQGDSSVVGAIWIESDGIAFNDRYAAELLAERLATLPFKELIIKVVDKGQAHYDSDFIPRARGVAENYDPLKTLIALLTDLDPTIRVIAWVDLIDLGPRTRPLPLPEDHPILKHEAWLSRDAEGRIVDSRDHVYLEPALPEVRELYSEIVGELARRYTIDGIYLDPFSDWTPADTQIGYHPAVVRPWLETQGPYAKPAMTDIGWISYRNQELLKTLTAMSRGIREANPNVVIAVGGWAVGEPPASLAEFPSTDIYRLAHQDWPQWMKLGLIDRLYIKDFQVEAQQADLFNAWLETALEAQQDYGVPVVIGVGGFLNSAVDTLAQLRRAAAMKPSGLALANFQSPVLDIGSRDLFFQAVNRTVLNEEVLSRLMQNQPRPDRLTADAAPVNTTELTPVLKDDAPGTGTAIGEVEYELPPPPFEAPNVGELIPVETPQPSGMARTTPRPEATPAPLRSTLRLPTQSEMVSELLSDPNFLSSESRGYISPEEESLRILKNTYSNIF